ncbi:MAG: Mut7-C RNAse domain-containing protein [Caldimicrobium sp.]
MKTFYLEASLSGLGKWLRFLGYKVEMASGRLTKEEILKNRDKFFLITSIETAEMLEKLQVDYLLLPRNSLKAQLLTLITKLNLKPRLTLDICTLCGSKLIPVKKEDFKEKIPPKVWERYSEFNYCPKCDKLYWEGDHIKRLKRRFKELITPFL